MRLHHQALVLVGAIVAAGIFLGTAARADIPVGYMGTPFKGAPLPIPGRIDLVNYDMGGFNVGFNTVHRSGPSAVGCAGSDYRMDLPVATLCKTSQMENDHFNAGPLKGTFYPTPTTADYYIGAVRPNDWVNFTVNVKTAGTYALSSTWASAGGSIDMKVFFNDVLKNETKLPTTGDYHNWVPYPSYATVQLDQGVQVMKFQSTVEHLNFDYIQFSLVLPDGGVDNGDSDAGTAPTSDAGGGGASGDDAGGGGAMGVGGAGGTSGSSAATSGAGGSPPGTGGGGETGQGGAPGATGSAGTIATAGSAGGAATNGTAADNGGCACTFNRALRSRGGVTSLALLLTGIAVRRRRRSSAA